MEVKESMQSAFGFLVEENERTVEDLLDNDYAILKLDAPRLRFYHGLIDKKRSEKLLFEFQHNFSTFFFEIFIYFKKKKFLKI